MEAKVKSYSVVVDLTKVQDQPKHWDFSLPPDWWEATEGPKHPLLGLGQELEAHITLTKVGKRFEVKGQFRTVLKLQCDRCLEVFSSPLDCVFSLILERLPQELESEKEYELGPEEMGVDFIKADEVDLTKMVKEQIYLSLPMKALCKEDCLGLCINCGANLNQGGCNCKVEQGHPAFQVLKALSLQS